MGGPGNNDDRFTCWQIGFIANAVLAIKRMSVGNINFISNFSELILVILVDSACDFNKLTSEQRTINRGRKQLGYCG